MSNNEKHYKKCVLVVILSYFKYYTYSDFHWWIHWASLVEGHSLPDPEHQNAPFWVLDAFFPVGAEKFPNGEKYLNSTQLVSKAVFERLNIPNGKLWMVAWITIDFTTEKKPKFKYACLDLTRCSKHFKLIDNYCWIICYSFHVAFVKSM